MHPGHDPVRHRIARVSVVLALAVAGASCRDDGAGDAAPTSPEPTADTPAPEWVMHEAADDCVCADGSEYVYFSRADDPERVVLYFQGGGACFSPETCSFEDGTYEVTAGPGDDPTGAPGIFDFDDERNPFLGWSMIFVPYCTGDVHLGDATHEYTPELTVEHNGFVNASQGLDHLLEHFPEATEVVVTGSSAGGVPAPLFGGLVADALPDAEVAVLADASGGYPSNSAVNSVIGELWGTDAAIPEWAEIAAGDVASFGIPDLFHLAGNHAPRIRMARYDNAYDEVQRIYAEMVNVADAPLLAVLDRNEDLIEAQDVDLSVYVAPGEMHTILASPELYALTVEGTPFVDWLTELVVGGMPADVRCTDCGEPGEPG